MRGRMVSRVPLRRHRPGLRGGVVETTGEGASGRATCRADAQRTPSPPIDVVNAAGGVAGVGAGVGVGEAGDVGDDAGAGAGGRPCMCVLKSG